MKIAIIGGIGSGKSEVSKIIESFGNLVISADKVYSEISQTSEYLDLLNVTFPGAVKDGKMDREFLGKIVFNNKEELQKLNAIAHPLVMKKIEEFLHINNFRIVFCSSINDEKILQGLS